jgi:FeS assembly SUF system regulator
MIRLSKLTDYGLVLMTYMGGSQPETVHTARELSLESRVPLPTVSKLLKELLASGLLVSYRGIKGGYSLAREPREISVAEIISALEGPVAFTECSTELSSCELQQCCPIKEHQRMISRVVEGALHQLMLSDLIHPLRLTTIQDARGNLWPAIVSTTPADAKTVSVGDPGSSQ